MFNGSSHSSIRRLAPVAAFLVTSLVTAGAYAATPTEDAQAAFHRGVRLAEDGQFGAALIEFDNSIALKATRAAAQNRALCLRRLGRFDDAVAALNALLAEKSLKRGDREAITNELHEMMDLFGTVTVVAPVGTEIFVDDGSQGTAPLPGPLSVGNGVHTVTARRGTVVVATGSVTVAAHANRDVTLTEVEAPPPAPLASTHSTIGPWILGGSGLVVAAVGGTFLYLRDAGARDTRDSLGTLTASEFETRRSRNTTFRTVGDVGVIVGSAAVAGALLWVALSPKETPPVACGPRREDDFGGRR